MDSWDVPLAERYAHIVKGKGRAGGEGLAE